MFYQNSVRNSARLDELAVPSGLPDPVATQSRVPNTKWMVGSLYRRHTPARSMRAAIVLRIGLASRDDGIFSVCCTPLPGAGLSNATGMRATIAVAVSHSVGFSFNLWSRLAALLSMAFFWVTFVVAKLPLTKPCPVFRA